MIIIAALTKKRVIGKDNKLLWNIPDDLKNFKRLTSGSTIIMGRKTYESIGRPLPNRTNIVISKKMNPADGIRICPDIENATKLAEEYGQEIFVIGGASIYEQMIPLCNKMYLSWVKKKYDGDAYFPEFDKKEWTLVKKEDYDDFEFCEYERKKPINQLPLSHPK